MSSSVDPMNGPSDGPPYDARHGVTTGAPEDLSLGERLNTITQDLSTLVRQELELAKAEAMQSGKRAGKGAGMLGGAGVAAHLMLIFVSLALAYLVGSIGDIGLGWGALVVALIWAVVAAVLASMGRKQFKDLGMPETADSAQRIPGAMKGQETA